MTNKLVSETIRQRLDAGGSRQGYINALRGVLDLIDGWRTDWPNDVSAQILMDRIEERIFGRLGLSAQDAPVLPPSAVVEGADRVGEGDWEPMKDAPIDGTVIEGYFGADEIVRVRWSDRPENPGAEIGSHYVGEPGFGQADGNHTYELAEQPKKWRELPVEGLDGSGEGDGPETAEPRVWRVADRNGHPTGLSGERYREYEGQWQVKKPGTWRQSGWKSKAAMEASGYTLVIDPASAPLAREVPGGER